MDTQNPNPEETKKSKAELLEDLVRSGLVKGTAEEWDNLTIPQIEGLLSLFEDAEEQPEFDVEKFKEGVQADYDKALEQKIAELESDYTAAAGKADPKEIKKLKETHNEKLGEKIIELRKNEQATTALQSKLKTIASQLLELTK